MKIGFLSCEPEYAHKDMEYIELSHNNTILEYDMLVIELEWLFSKYDINGNYNGIAQISVYDSNKIVEDMQKRKSELLDFLNSGKTVVIFNANDNYRFRYTGEKNFSGTGRNTRVTNIVKDIHPTEILPIPINSFKLEGTEVSLKNKKIEDFYNKYMDKFRFVTAYEKIEKSDILLTIQNTEKVVSFFKKIKNGILLFLPTLKFDVFTKEIGQRLEKQYFEDIYQLSKKLKFNEEISLPEFSKQYLLPNEEKKYK